MSIFSRLNYNYSDSIVTEMSSNTKSFMNTVPSLINDWQTEDIANDDTGGYFKNPVSTVTQTIRDTSNTLVTLLQENPGANTSEVRGTTTPITILFNTIQLLSANTGGNNGGFFISHTDRISGITSVEQSVKDGVDVSLVPHYDTAISQGQILTYLTNQSDGIQNNSPIMGNFTSITIAQELSDYSNTISAYYETINTSITTTGTGANNETDPIIRTSSLSLSVVQEMSNNVVAIHDMMRDRRVHDEEFYRNSKAVVEDYNSVKGFSDMGATQEHLVKNYIGSDKLLARINS